MAIGAGALPLAGLRALELGHIVAGPSAALILADLGADVVKIERPGGGDQARQMPGGSSSVFDFLNRNKRSVVIDAWWSPPTSSSITSRRA
jgi:crotonobetainyl-CoA:carnitine CoA-transferase CaiB-like acyl-CoA transferase